MSNIILSVIMPIYNTASTLTRAFDSILMQETEYQYEVIVVDDCSTDGSRNICDEYARKFNNFIYHRNSVNSGNAFSFYTGLCLASGDFFCVLDGDDFYTVSNKFQRQIHFLINDTDERYVAVGHYFLYYHENGAVHIIEDHVSEFEYGYLDFLQGQWQTLD